MSDRFWEVLAKAEEFCYNNKGALTEALIATILAGVLVYLALQYADYLREDCEDEEAE